MAQYETLTSRKFNERQEAEAWAKKQKEEWKNYGDYGSMKIDIDFLKETNEWRAKLLVPLQ